MECRRAIIGERFLIYAYKSMPQFIEYNKLGDYIFKNGILLAENLMTSIENHHLLKKN